MKIIPSAAVFAVINAVLIRWAYGYFASSYARITSTASPSFTMPGHYWSWLMVLWALALFNCVTALVLIICMWRGNTYPTSLKMTLTIAWVALIGIFFIYS